ncbi:protein CHROMATIN REMODELING 35-like [Brassica napus]|uniref:protein CHROMATIN REMODELING 35-like n=1 Tax=Brassica napus TaxID=3708 RepID=UPI002078EE05|nr:protein CHROMATIN REMODELING 35-like [Brassica napus]
MSGKATSRASILDRPFFAKDLLLSILFLRLWLVGKIGYTWENNPALSFVLMKEQQNQSQEKVSKTLAQKIGTSIVRAIAPSKNFASHHSDVLENLSPTAMDRVEILIIFQLDEYDHHDKMESRRGSGRSLVSEVVTTFVYKDTAWILRSESKRISQSELGKRPDPFFLLDLLDWFEESKYGWLADDVKRLCELKRKLLNGSVSVDLPQESVTTEDCSGSDASPERYNEEDSSSKTPTDDDNETHLNGVYEEEEAELWRQMAFAQESSKVTVENVQDNDPKQTEDCEHSFIYKDDVGEVCRVCGLIKTPIENIIEVVYYKPKRSGRAYTREQEEETETTRMDFTETHSSSHTNNILGDKMFIHPRHDYEMRPHQIVGFKFLCNNLTSEEPGGCILAHAPGSGKTFLLFSFLQSFMAMDPQAKPLIVLPKGIIESWKREFTKWAVENIPLYSVKAESRKQQLKVLREWVEERSILFLGYQQFAKIICDDSIIIDDEVSEDCKRILLEKPTLLILDEGHTSRNKETNMLISLARVRTPRKVVLTGTFVFIMADCYTLTLNNRFTLFTLNRFVRL